MAEIIRCYREMVPAMRFIGRKYDAFTDWGACFESDVFGAVERAMGGVEAIRALWKDGGGYVGLERRCDGEPFAYYIGMFAPPDTPVPDRAVRGGLLRSAPRRLLGLRRRLL